MKLQPAPLTTSIIQNYPTNKPWEMFFRNVSTNLEESTRIFETSGVYGNYNGNILTLSFSGIVSQSFPIKIKESSITQKIPYYYFNTIWNIDVIEIQKGVKEIVIPSGNIMLNCSIMVNS